MKFFSESKDKNELDENCNVKRKRECDERIDIKQKKYWCTLSRIGVVTIENWMMVFIMIIIYLNNQIKKNNNKYSDKSTDTLFIYVSNWMNNDNIGIKGFEDLKEVNINFSIIDEFYFSTIVDSVKDNRLNYLVIEGFLSFCLNFYTNPKNNSQLT